MLKNFFKKKAPCTNLFNAISHFKFKGHLTIISWVLMLKSQVDNLIHDLFSGITHISQLQMKNVISFLISKFQDLSNGILEAQFGPNLLLALVTIGGKCGSFYHVCSQTSWWLVWSYRTWLLKMKATISRKHFFVSNNVFLIRKGLSFDTCKHTILELENAKTYFSFKTILIEHLWVRNGTRFQWTSYSASNFEHELEF